jgi:hypothetical protein
MCNMGAYRDRPGLSRGEPDVNSRFSESGPKEPHQGCQGMGTKTGPCNEMAPGRIAENVIMRWSAAWRDIAGIVMDQAVGQADPGTRESRGRIQTGSHILGISDHEYPFAYQLSQGILFRVSRNRRVFENDRSAWIVGLA